MLPEDENLPAPRSCPGGKMMGIFITLENNQIPEVIREPDRTRAAGGTAK
jgi:hypothetical protein